MFGNDIQIFMKKCVRVYYMRQYKWSQPSLWRYSCHELGFKLFVFSILKHVNIWYNIILPLTLINNVKLYVSYLNYSIDQTRSVTIFIIYNKMRWYHHMTKTTFRWPNRWCGELSLPHHRNIPPHGNNIFLMW